jgi:type VI secretion system secreted protein Hcp
MNFLRSHKLVSEAKLTVRKAGQTPLEYFKIELWQVRITALETQSEGTDLIERLRLGFSRVKVSYTPQGSHGGGGGGDNVFDADAHAGT